MTFTLT